MPNLARWAAAVVAVSAWLAAPMAVLGHAELISSSPDAGDNLDTAPTEVTITFDDELDPDHSSFTVTDADGGDVGSGEVDLTVADRNVMTGAVSITDPGVYTVSYTVAGLDGHQVDGTFSFGFNALQQIPDPTGGEGSPDTAMPVPEPPLAQLAGGLLLGLAILISVRRRPGRLGGIFPVALLGAALAACVPSASLPAACNDPSVTFAATLAQERLEPATFDVCRGQQVTITFTIQRDGILHLHGYDDQLAAQEVRTGQTVDYRFEAIHAGQFPIALHPTDGSAEVDVGTLIVNEP